MPKAAVTFTVVPVCRSCKVPMSRNYDRMAWVCPLCGSERTDDHEEASDAKA
jgi:predicted RNA-binding Zn-ribbon protein involved in translation (DUF1610 family)